MAPAWLDAWAGNKNACITCDLVQDYFEVHNHGLLNQEKTERLKQRGMTVK